MRFMPGTKDRTPADRAENARRRRSERTQERVSTVKNRVVSAARNRPVTSRGNLFGSPILQKAGSRKNRRAFYVTMDQRGSELRLPALPVLNPGWRLVSGLIALLAIFGIYSFYGSPFFEILSVEVQGLQRISADEIRSELGLENRSIIEVDRSAVFGLLSEKYPELVEIKVDVEMPNYIAISAVERQPVLAWVQGDATRWVDAEGFIFPARGEAGAIVTIQSDNSLPLEPLPVEELVEVSQTQVSETGEVEEAQPGFMAALLRPGDAVKKTEKSPEQANLILLAAAQELSQKLDPGTLLVYNDLNGLGWTAPEGWQVYIGRDLNQFDEKYALYQKLVGYLNEQGIQPTLVSVEYINAPFYRAEQ